MIFNALAYLDIQISVYVIGVKPEKTPLNINLEYHTFIQSKLDYLRILSKSWIGINVGFHNAGTNQKKYDYAEAGAVVFSDKLGARGDLLAHEYTYVDSHDLAAKIKQIFELNRKRLIEMGKQNRDQVLFMAERERQRLLQNLIAIIDEISSQ